ncbi:MAG: type 4a pilus biogenesis protein PilO [Acidobacteriota bacterium]
MNKQQSTKPNKALRVISSILLALTLLWGCQEAADYYYFQSQYAEIAKVRERLAQLQYLNDENERIKANSEQLERAFAEAEERYRALRPLLPPEAELPKVLDWMANQATQRNLKLEHFSQGTQIKQQGAMSEIPIQVEVLGYYDGVMRFIDDFSRFERILRVRGVRMVQQEGQSDYTTVRANISFSAYVSKNSLTSTKSQEN